MRSDLPIPRNPLTVQPVMIPSTLHAAEHEIQSADLVSFDLFDTLITRCFVSPLHIFSYIERHYKCPGFREARVSTELELRRRLTETKDPRDLSLQEIYQHLPAAYHALENIECEVEFQFLVPCPSTRYLYDFAAERAKVVIITTETYLSVDFIERVLQKTGLSRHKHLFVSNACGLRKCSGLYKYISSHIPDISSSRCLHIGDNERADVLAPLQQGWRSHHLPSTVDVAKQSALVHDEYLGTLAHSDQLDISLTTKAAADCYATQNSKTPLPQSAGSLVVFPAIGALVLWVAESCRRMGIRRLFFVSRDGFIIKPIFDTLINTQDEYETRELFLSRRCLSVPVESRYDPNFSLLMYGVPASLSRKSFWKHTGLESVDLYNSWLNYGDPHGSEDQVVTSGLCSDFLFSHRGLVLSELERERDLVVSYLHQEHVFTEPCAFIDIGWSGTMQRSLRLLAAELGHPYRITGFYVGTGRYCVLTSREQSGFFTTNGLPNDLQQLLNPAIDLLELLFTVPAQSVRTIQRQTDGSYAPRFFEPDGREHARMDFSTHVNIGNLRTAALLADRIKDSGYAITGTTNDAVKGAFLKTLHAASHTLRQSISDVPVFASHSTSFSQPIQLP